MQQTWIHWIIRWRVVTNTEYVVFLLHRQSAHEKNQHWPPISYNHRMGHSYRFGKYCHVSNNKTVHYYKPLLTTKFSSKLLYPHNRSRQLSISDHVCKKKTKTSNVSKNNRNFQIGLRTFTTPPWMLWSGTRFIHYFSYWLSTIVSSLNNSRRRQLMYDIIGMIVCKTFSV